MLVLGLGTVVFGIGGFAFMAFTTVKEGHTFGGRGSRSGNGNNWWKKYGVTYKGRLSQAVGVTANAVLMVASCTSTSMRYESHSARQVYIHIEEENNT